jgi:hypothetical protein
LRRFVAFLRHHALFMHAAAGASRRFTIVPDGPAAASRLFFEVI